MALDHVGNPWDAVSMRLLLIVVVGAMLNGRPKLCGAAYICVGTVLVASALDQWGSFWDAVATRPGL